MAIRVDNETFAITAIIGVGLLLYFVRPEKTDAEVAQKRNDDRKALAIRNLAVLEGKADAGLAVASVAHQFRLDFLDLHQERYDLAVRRRDFFEAPVQALLAFAASDGFATRAAEMAGYDVSGLGRVVYNAP